MSTPAPSRLRRAATAHAPAWLLFALPGTLCLVLGVTLVGRMNGVDEYIYVGAVERLSDFLQRWPDTYYAVRFGYLLPEWLFSRAFGSDLGYVVLRFVLLGAMAVTLRLRGAMNTAAAALGALVTVTSPIVLAAAFTTYTVSLGTLYTMLGAALLATCSLGEGRAVIRAIGAGAVFGLAWNSHLALLPVCAIAMTVFAVDELVTGRRDRPVGRIALAVAVGAGTLLTVGGGVLIYRWQFHVNDVYGPTLRQAKQDTNAVFLEKSSFEWLTWRYYLLAGPLAVVAGVVAWRAEQHAGMRRALRRLTITTAVSFAAFAWFEWAQDNPLLSIFYYSCVPLGLALLTLGFALTSTANRLETRQAVRLGAALGIVVLLTLRFTSSVRPPYAVVVALALIVAAALVVGAARRRLLFPLLSLITVVIAWVSVASPHDFAAATAGFRVDPYYDKVLFTYNLDGVNQVRVAREFAQALPSLPANRGEIRVWFDSTGSMNQVVSTLVWYRSGLQVDSDPPMPTMTDVVTQRVTQDRPRYIVVLDEQAADVKIGVSEIEELGPYRQVWSKLFKHGSAVANATLLERTDGAWNDYPCLGPAGNAVFC